MTISHVGRRLKAQIEEEIQKLSDWIIGGSAGEYSEYTSQVGVITGLKRALQILEEIEKED